MKISLIQGQNLPKLGAQPSNSSPGGLTPLPHHEGLGLGCSVLNMDTSVLVRPLPRTQSDTLAAPAPSALHKLSLMTPPSWGHHQQAKPSRSG